MGIQWEILIVFRHFQCDWPRRFHQVNELHFAVGGAGVGGGSFCENIEFYFKAQFPWSFLPQVLYRDIGIE